MSTAYDNSGNQNKLESQGALDWFAFHTGSKVENVSGSALDEYDPTVDNLYLDQNVFYPSNGNPGETDTTIKNNYVQLIPKPHRLLRYFMDGSRRACKLAEFKKDGKVWPIVAGQIGVACCERIDRQMRPIQKLTNGSYGGRVFRNIISVPRAICGLGGTDVAQNARLEEFRKGINDRLRWNKKVQFDTIVTYDEKKDDDLTNLAISKIQALMVATEKAAICQLAEDGMLADGKYLVKDGSLEYRDDALSEIKWKSMEGRLQYAVGVSKSFDPNLFRIRVKTETQSAAAFIASIPYGARTRAFRYSLQKDKPPFFAVWYLRIRLPRLLRSAFDGVLKVEMQLVGDEERIGKSSTQINNISEDLLNEANPVCFGADSRWANHIYPVYVTERYLKSGFLPDRVFESVTR